ncbi:MAG: S41 family peptidase [Acidobacteriota bacterium]
MRNKPFLTILAAALVAGALSGGLLSDRALATTWQNENLIHSFANILQIVEDRYEGQVNPDQLVEGAINGMLRTLDPHSHYLNMKAYRAMREEQQGSFSGLGIVIQKLGRDRPLTVISPIGGTPAARLGIRAGDIIARINGEPTDHISSSEAVERLRGAKGTEVHITVVRPGLEEDLEFTIVRDTIPTDSIVNAYMIEPDTGYVKIRNFTQTTNHELRDALKKLEQKGMKRLTLDLRANPGGLLDQAVAVADTFLERGKKLVYTRGRIRGSNKDYYASDDATYPDLPLVVLVNRGSASASEIVAGAIQDHDRGLIVGETTWGKGLVQSVFPLSHSNALALTTAKYYTPSGRLIQRDYRSLENYVAYRTDENYHPAFDHSAKKFTDAGRTVYGGGGIQPDVEVKMQEPSKLITRMYRTSAFFRFAVTYLQAHPDISPDFEMNDEILGQFQRFLEDKEIPFEPKEITAHKEMVGTLLKAEILSARFGLVYGERTRNHEDTQIQKALTLFSQAQELALLSDHGAKTTAEPRVDLDGPPLEAGSRRRP